VKVVHIQENVVKVLDLVEKMNVVVNMVGVESQMTIVVKVVNPNLENVIMIIKFPRMEDVVKVLDLVKIMNAAVNMDGVENQMIIVVKDVNPNLENVNQQVPPPLLLQQQNLMPPLKPLIVENVVKVLVPVEKENAVPSTDGVENQMTTVVKDVNQISENVNQQVPPPLLLLQQQQNLMPPLKHHIMENVEKVLVHAKKGNAVPSTDGVESQMTTVVKDVNQISENVNQQVPPLLLLQQQQNLMTHLKLLIVENVVKVLVHVEKGNAAVNMDGVERQMTTVVKDVNPTLGFAIMITQ